MNTIDKFRKIIKNSGFTQAHIARETGISQSQLSMFISKKRGITVAKAVTIANFLGYEFVIEATDEKLSSELKEALGKDMILLRKVLEELDIDVKD